MENHLSQTFTDKLFSTLSQVICKFVRAVFRVCLPTMPAGIKMRFPQSTAQNSGLRRSLWLHRIPGWAGECSHWLVMSAQGQVWWLFAPCLCFPYTGRVGVLEWHFTLCQFTQKRSFHKAESRRHYFLGSCLPTPPTTSSLHVVLMLALHYPPLEPHKHLPSPTQKIKLSPLWVNYGMAESCKAKLTKNKKFLYH